MRDNRTDRQGKNYFMNKIFIKRKPMHCKVESVRKNGSVTEKLCNTD